MLDSGKPYDQFVLDEWLAWLANRHSDEIQLGLSRIRQVYQRLNLAKPAANIITVAGTNGKGSVVTLLEEIYVKAGYRVGTYTSPHLDVFNERIRVNQQPISDQALCQLFVSIETNRAANFLTYFEATTLAALAYFSQQHLDIAILEVGLGGRLDAVNIIDTDCAVITTIDYDHQEYLGSTIEAIAAEKSGIIRSKKPTIFGDYTLPQAIQSKANQVDSALYQIGVDFDYHNEGSLTRCQVDKHSYQISSHVHPQSCAIAMMVIKLMHRILPVTDHELIDAVNHCYIPGRLQWIKRQSLWLLDVAHNMQAVRRLFQVIKESNIAGNIRLVFSVCKDKPYGQMIELMAKLSQNWYIAPLTISRTAATLELMSEIGHHKGNCFVFDSVGQACEQVAIDASKKDLIVVFGSFVTVQMARFFLKKMGKIDEIYNG